MNIKTRVLLPFTFSKVSSDDDDVDDDGWSIAKEDSGVKLSSSWILPKQVENIAIIRHINTFILFAVNVHIRILTILFILLVDIVNWLFK